MPNVVSQSFSLDCWVYPDKNRGRPTYRQIISSHVWPEWGWSGGELPPVNHSVGCLSGAGIFNGVTKYVAEHHQDPEKLRAVLGTSSTLILGFSTLLALIFLFFSGPISEGLFDSKDYQSVIQAVAFIQMGIAYANYFLAILKGYRDASGNAQSIIFGSIIGVVAYYLCYTLGGYDGALAGLALVPALVVLPAALMMIRRKRFALSMLKPAWDKAVATNLGKFTIMALITSVTLPLPIS